jgi:plasminogen activator inhibitor 1 RNA-binding protein
MERGPCRRLRQLIFFISDTRKQVQQGWGANTGEKAWDDERVGENIAKEDENEPQTPADEEAKELADKSKSYSDYLAEQAQKDSLAAKPVRSANEGSKADSKWAAAKELKRDDEEDAYIQASSEKAKREKQRKEKHFLDVDMRFVEQPRTGGPVGGRGGARGGRGGDRAPRGDRGGAPRGDRGGAPRGAPRGGDRGRGGARGGAPRGGPRGPAGPTVDEKNFPSLGGK